MKKFVVVITILLVSLSVFIITLLNESLGLDTYGNKTYQVDTGEIKTGFKVIGKGDPFLFLMGLGGTMENWPKTIIDLLSYEYQVILIDNRGMGYSTDTDETF